MLFLQHIYEYLHNETTKSVLRIIIDFNFRTQSNILGIVRIFLSSMHTSVVSDSNWFKLNISNSEMRFDRSRVSRFLLFIEFHNSIYFSYYKCLGGVWYSLVLKSAVESTFRDISVHIPSGYLGIVGVTPNTSRSA